MKFFENQSEFSGIGNEKNFKKFQIRIMGTIYTCYENNNYREFNTVP